MKLDVKISWTDSIKSEHKELADTDVLAIDSLNVDTPTELVNEIANEVFRKFNVALYPNEVKSVVSNYRELERYITFKE